jgi:hypothetical protein
MFTSPHHFAYVDADIPEGLTIAEWRRRRLQPVAPRPLRARLQRVARRPRQ